MANASDHADECMLCALEAFCAELQVWLKDGGDRRLEEFSPLTALCKVTNHLAAMQDRGETQHLH